MRMANLTLLSLSFNKERDKRVRSNSMVKNIRGRL
jgi:hypothetical protein